MEIHTQLLPMNKSASQPSAKAFFSYLTNIKHLSVNRQIIPNQVHESINQCLILVFECVIIRYVFFSFLSEQALESLHRSINVSVYCMILTITFSLQFCV